MTRSVFTEHYRYFLQLLIQERKNAGLSQQQLANKLNRPQSYISKYECGERRLDVIELLEVSEAIGFNVITLIQKLKTFMKENE
jgi:transcriptional regulator with XRE-family HTH domain